MESLIERSKNTIYFYNIKFKSKEAIFNVPNELPAYFEEMIGDKTEVKIAELGSGPVCTIGNLWKNRKVQVFASDVLQPEYLKLWAKYNKVPIVPIMYEDMENLSYQSDFFDIVHCVNTLDHTKDAKRAVSEMIRVCKTGGYVYLRHAPDQRKRYKGMHEWDINFENSETIFKNPKERFSLSELGPFKSFLEPSRKEDLIVSILCKI